MIAKNQTFSNKNYPFNSCWSLFFIYYSSLFACCSLLVTFCSLLLTFYSLLITFCSLLRYFLLVAHYFLLLALLLLLVAHFFFLHLMLWMCNVNWERESTTEIVLTSVLVASAKISECKGSLSPSRFYGQLLITRISLIYLVDGFLIFSLLFLHKEMRRSDESPITSCFFCVWCKSREKEVEFKIPLCNPSGGELLIRPSSSYNKLLGRVAFRILSNIHDGFFLWN